MEHTSAGQSWKVKCRKKAGVISVLEDRLAEDDMGYCELKVFQTIRLILWKTTPDDVLLFIKTNQCTLGQ